MGVLITRITGKTRLLFPIHIDIHPYFKSVGEIEETSLHVSLAGSVGDRKSDDMGASERSGAGHAGIDERRLTPSPPELGPGGGVSEIADVVGDGKQPGGHGLTIHHREKSVGIGVTETALKLKSQHVAGLRRIGQPGGVGVAEQLGFTRSDLSN